MRSLFWMAVLLALVSVREAQGSQLYINYVYPYVAENAGTATVSVSLSPSSVSAVTVEYSTADVYPGLAPAIAGVHYQGQSGTLTFQPGELTRLIQIPLIDNPDVNQARGFQVFLFNPNGAVLTENSSFAYVQITDNEIPNLVDGSFNTGSGLESYDESFGIAKALLLQPDGKVLVAGDFNTVSGNLRKGLARLNGNGSYDTNFNQGEGIDGKVYSLALQADGKILAGGAFLSANQSGHTNVVRFNADGTIDSAFNPYTEETGEIRRAAIQADGKILVGGTFNTMNGTGRKNLARVLSNGLLDSTFNAPSLSNLSVRALALLPDGRVMVGGNVLTNLPTDSRRILRLLPNGAIDGSFNASVGPTDGDIRGLTLQSDGKVYVYGSFYYYAGGYHGGLLRLNSDGSVDPGIGSTPAGSVNDLILQPDGKVLLGTGERTDYPDPVFRFLLRFNPDGSQDSSFPPGGLVNDQISCLALQPDGKVLIGGAFSSVDSISRIGIARLNFQTNNDNAFIFSKNKYTENEERGFANIKIRRSGSSAEARSVVLTTSDVTAMAGNDYIGQTNLVTFAPLQTEREVSIPLLDDGLVEREESVRLTLTNPSSGSDIGLQGVATLVIEEDERPVLVDTSFNPGTGANRKIYSMARQPDGKLVIGGQFTKVNEIPRPYVARLNTDGSLDLTFNPPPITGYVRGLVLQPDGKIVIGGQFYYVSGATHYGIARLNVDGSLDTNFNAYVLGSGNLVNAVALQSDGKILVAGTFYNVNGQNYNNLARLNPGGDLDLSFNNNSLNPYLASLALQADGKILAGSYYSSVIVRYLPNGLVDTNFAPPGMAYSPTNYYYFPYGRVKAIAVLPDNKIVVGGLFSNTRRHIARLNADGSIDAGFNVGDGPNNSVNAIAVQTDGKLVIGGEFFKYNNISSRRIARLNANGSLDFGFNPGKGANDEIQCVLIQPDGKIIYGGEFSAMNGINIDHIVRLYSEPVNFESVSWSDVDLAVNEAERTQVLTLRRYGPATNSISVSYSTSDGTATAGNDYDAQSGTITLNPPEVTKTITVSIHDDGIPEEDERFYVTAVPQTAGVEQGFNTVAAVRIKDNETPLYLDYGFNQTNIVYGTINAILVQPDGNIVVGGVFNDFTNHANLTRLRSDGSADPGFKGNGTDGEVRALALQSGGKILVGGSFTRVNNAVSFNLARLAADGAFDSTFKGTNFDNQVRSIVVQPDQKVLVAGNFTLVNGLGRPRVARLSADGTADLSFDPGSGANDRVRSLALQTDGKVLLAGRFTSVNGTNRQYVARLNSTGGLDTSFDPGAGPDNEVRGVALQTDGKVIIGGEFVSVAGIARSYVARLNVDGTLDTSFVPPVLTYFPGNTALVSGVAVQPDGRILVAGTFYYADGFQRRGLVRLNTDGSIDHTLFQSQEFYSNPTAVAVATQPDGRILVGGFQISGVSPVARYLGDSVSNSSIEFGQRFSMFTNITESITNFSLELRRIGNVGISSSAQVFVLPGSAEAGSDYIFTNQAVTFQPFETSKTLSASLLDDDLAEPDETLSIVLGSPGLNTVLGGYTNLIIRILDNERPGSRDTRFNPNIASLSYVEVREIIVQPDKKILAAGTFYSAQGVPLVNIARFEPGGKPDDTFQPELPAGFSGVTGMGLQPSGKIIVQNGSQLIRLNADGSLDNGFPTVSTYYWPMLTLPDGRFICASYGTNFSRFLPDGALDGSFLPIPMGALPYFSPFALEGNGNILHANGNDLARYAANGTFLGTISVGDYIRTLLVQPDGKILVGSYQSATPLRRLNADGTPDNSFTPLFVGGYYQTVSKILRQPDGKLVVVGDFASVNGIPRDGVVRLNPNGSVDMSFDTGLSLPTLIVKPYLNGYTYSYSYSLNSAALDSEGRVLVGANFSTYDPPGYGGLTRLNGDLPLRLHKPSRTANGSWNLAVDTMPGRKVVLQSALDLPNWTPVATNTASAWYLNYILTNSPSGRQFYRAQQIP